MVILMSNLAFGSATVFSMKRLFVGEAEQQNIVNWTMLMVDIGLATVLVLLAAFMLWRLFDLFKAKGNWVKEYKSEVKKSAEAELIEQKRKLKELEATIKEVSQ
jgi:hypothetical protein